MKSILSETNNLWGSSFFPKHLKFYVGFGNEEKNWENIFRFQIIAFELVALNTRFYWDRILFTGFPYVKKQSQHFRYYSDRTFQVHFLSEWSRNMTNILPLKFKQCFGVFNMLTSQKCSDTRLFRHLSNLAFCSL